MRSLIESDLVTPATRAVLLERLDAPAVSASRFFTPAEFVTLRAVCDRLIAQGPGLDRVDVAGTFDSRMADGVGDGWRYAIMPPDADMHRTGLHGIEQAAEAAFARAFDKLAESEQDELLRSLQTGTAAGAVWDGMDPRRYFEELLTQAADIYYAHPLASEAIGYVGMADAHGWQAIGLGRRDAHEPAA